MVTILPGTQCNQFMESVSGKRIEPATDVEFIVEYRHKGDASEPRGGWVRRSDPTPLRSAGDDVPDDWALQPNQQSAGSHHVVAAWVQPPGTGADDIE